MANSECRGVTAEPTWLCKDGRLLALNEMSDQHLVNTYALLERSLLKSTTGKRAAERIAEQMLDFRVELASCGVRI